VKNVSLSLLPEACGCRIELRKVEDTVAGPARIEVGLGGGLAAEHTGPSSSVTL